MPMGYVVELIEPSEKDVLFEKFSDKKAPTIRRIRFGWLDSSDWIGQKSQTGQQSRLPPEVYKYKLIQVYESS